VPSRTSRKSSLHHDDEPTAGHRSERIGMTFKPLIYLVEPMGVEPTTS
jgi:hypothetical protein